MATLGLGRYRAAGVTVADTKTEELQLDVNGNLKTTADVTIAEFPAAAAITDNFANPTTTSVMSMLMAYDGANWDRMVGDSTNGLIVNLGVNNDIQGDVAHDGVDANNPQKIGGKAFDPATPQTAVSANDRVNAMFDLNGRLIIYLGSLLFGEDATEGLIGTAEKPTSTSTYMPSIDVSAAAEASSVSKASTGNLFGFTATNSSGSSRYFQVYNSTTVPADATVPALSYFVAAGGTVSDSWPKGRNFSTGISWAWSSTAATKTVGSTDGIADVRFK